MVPNLKIVSERPALAAAIEGRARSLTGLNEVASAADRLRGLIAAETASRSALEALEHKSATAASAWARGETAELDVIDAEVLDAARRDLAHASHLASAARAALPTLAAGQTQGVAAREAAEQRLDEAINGELNLLADKIRAQQLEYERLAADCVASLAAMERAFAVRQGEAFAVSARGRFRQKIASWISSTRNRVNPNPDQPREDLVRQFVEFAGRLRKDPTAKFEGF